VDLEQLANKIRSQREKRGLKQQDIANALHISPQAVSKWERGENAPDIAVLGPLACLLGVSVDWLLSAHEERMDVFEATVLVSSVYGAYERSLGMEPRDFATWANGLFLKLTETTLRYDGIPVKYMGDQYLCFFSGARHRERAVTTAQRSKGLVAEDLKIGLSAGDVHLGSVGHPDYARPDIMGEVVNSGDREQARTFLEKQVAPAFRDAYPMEEHLLFTKFNFLTKDIVNEEPSRFRSCEQPLPPPSMGIVLESATEGDLEIIENYFRKNLHPLLFRSRGL